MYASLTLPLGLEIIVGKRKNMRVTLYLMMIVEHDSITLTSVKPTERKCLLPSLLHSIVKTEDSVKKIIWTKYTPLYRVLDDSL